MSPSDEFLKGVYFGALIGGIFIMVLLKLWKKKRAAQGKTGAEKNFKKRPTEHDERF